MRKSRIVLTIMTTVAFSALLFNTSCETKNEEPVMDTADTTTMDMEMDNSGNAITRFRKALADLPQNEVVAIFNGMTPEFRATLWRNRLSDAMNTDMTDDQKNILLSAVENISAETYTDEGAEKFMTFYADFRPAAIKAFADDTVKLLNIVTKLDEPKELSKEDESAEKAKKDCDCNVSDDWCAISFDCKPRNCKVSRWGCGWFGLKSCDGLCIFQR